MYLPKHFEQSDPAELHALMRAHPLATLVTLGSEGLDANLIPLLLIQEDDKTYLRGHVARGNPEPPRVPWRLVGLSHAGTAA